MVKRKIKSTSDSPGHASNVKRQKQTTKKKRKCYNCQEIGHYANECTKLRPKIVEPKSRKFLGCLSDKVNSLGDSNNNSWILDSGATTHGCNKSYLFSELNSCTSSIVVCDNRTITVYGRGTVRLRVNSGKIVNTLILNDVAFASDLGANFVSTVQLES